MGTVYMYSAILRAIDEESMNRTWLGGLNSMGIYKELIAL